MSNQRRVNRKWAATCACWAILWIAATTTPARAGEVTFDTDGTAIIDGKRTYLYGTFRDPSDDWRDFSGVLEGGFNLTHSYHFESSSWGDLTAPGKQLSDWIAQAAEYLDLAEQAGVGVFLGMPRWAVLHGDTATLTAIATALKDKPALLFWDLMDEPLGHARPTSDPQLTPQLMEAAYTAIKQADPDHPVIVIDRRRPEITATPEDWWQHSDSVWVDKYAIPSTGPLPSGLTTVYTEYAGVQQAVPNKVIHSVLQGHDYRITLPENAPNDPLTLENIRPTLAQLRTQVHLAIAAGSKVTTFYWFPSTTWSLPEDSPDQWQNFVKVGREMGHLGDALASDDVLTDHTVTTQVSVAQRGATDAEVDIQHWSRFHDRALYIGIVNPGGWAKSTTFNWTDQVGVHVDLDWSLIEQVSVVTDVLTVAMTRDGNGSWLVDPAAFGGLFQSFDGTTLRLRLDFADSLVLKMQTIPEPGTVIVLAVGSALLRRGPRGPSVHKRSTDAPTSTHT